MIDRWRKLLLCLGITPNYKGFHFLLTCLELLQNDPMALLQVTKSLYPVVAKHHNTSWRTVERDLRTVVNLSFQVNPTYLGTLARRSVSERPTVSQFLAIPQPEPICPCCGPGLPQQGLLLQQLVQQPAAPLQNVPVCGLKISGIPGIGHLLPGTSGIVQQQMNLTFGVSPQYSAHIAHIGFIHADEQIIGAIILCSQPPGTMISVGHAMSG